MPPFPGSALEKKELGEGGRRATRRSDTFSSPAVSVGLPGHCWRGSSELTCARAGRRQPKEMQIPSQQVVCDSTCPRHFTITLARWQRGGLRRVTVSASRSSPRNGAERHPSAVLGARTGSIATRPDTTPNPRLLPANLLWANNEFAAAPHQSRRAAYEPRVHYASVLSTPFLLLALSIPFSTPASVRTRHLCVDVTRARHTLHSTSSELTTKRPCWLSPES